VLRLRRYERISVQNLRFHSNGARLTQISSRRARPSTNHSSSQKTGLNGLSYGTKTGQIFLPFSHNASVWQRDRPTERILIARPRLHSMQCGIMLSKNLHSLLKYQKSRKGLLFILTLYVHCDASMRTHVSSLHML